MSARELCFEMVSADLAVAKQHALLGGLTLPSELEHGV